jgi:hypothetical protein
MLGASMAHSKIATAVVSSAGIAIALVVGYFLHEDAKARSEARQAVAVVGEATAQLKVGLKTVSPEALARVEAGLETARGWSDAELTDAAEHYLVGAREILRRRAEASRIARQAAASRAALAAHMNRAARRDSAWIRTASALKKRVEDDHFELNNQLTALAELLDTLPEANKRLAPHVEASFLLDEQSRRRFHSAALAEAKRAEAQLAKARSFLR